MKRASGHTAMPEDAVVLDSEAEIGRGKLPDLTQIQYWCPSVASWILQRMHQAAGLAVCHYHGQQSDLVCMPQPDQLGKMGKQEEQQ